MDNIEHEICNNCKKEIPQTNYIMHTMHCSRNITLCKNCNEPIPKLDYENHREKCIKKSIIRKPFPQQTSIEKSVYFQQRKNIEDVKAAARKEDYIKRHEHLIDRGFTLKETVTNGHFNNYANQKTSSDGLKTSLSAVAVSSRNNHNSNIGGGAIKKEQKIVTKPQEDHVTSTSQGLLACKYCDLELPKIDLDEHENYCGTRTDKCLECGELVMFKNKQVHLDSNHGFVKLKDEPGPRPSWESTTARSASSPLLIGRNRFSSATRLNADFDYDPMPYLPSAYQSNRSRNMKKKEGESYKEISRRLDCKTEYIRNLLHDSACITIPLRSSATAPRNHFNHNKGPAPQPPSFSSTSSSSVRSRRNPPTELVIPCEFCDTPIPHEELIQHETGCRPDLTKCNPRRNRSLAALAAEDDDYYVPPPNAVRSDSPDDEELPCEFCANMVPASQLWRHQLSCTTPA